MNPLPSDSSTWLPPDNRSFQLEKNIHVWKCNLNLLLPLPFEKHLSPEEKLRAAACRSPQVRQKLIRTRFILRELLARYLDMPPQEIPLSVNARGKVELVDSQLHFNLSHSHSILLLAFCREKRVGIDVEKIRARTKISQLARRCLSDSEMHDFEAAADEAKLAYFYQRWTLKEALLKAWGEGLRIPMKSVEIAGQEDKREWLEYRAEASLFACRLCVLPSPGLNDAAALALEGEALPICFWNADFLLEK